MTRLKYRKKADQFVIAVQLNLQTDGFSYEKWGSSQRCSAGDWLVNNNGDCYTINADSFARTYDEITPGHFIKTATIWAEQATEAGVVETTEGSTAYKTGDYIVSNNADGSDAYAIAQAKFISMYELVE